jgi:hypothetical protein
MGGMGSMGGMGGMGMMPGQMNQMNPATMMMAMQVFTATHAPLSSAPVLSCSPQHALHPNSRTESLRHVSAAVARINAVVSRVRYATYVLCIHAWHTLKRPLGVRGC